MKHFYQALFVSANITLGLLYPLPYITIYLGFGLGFLTYCFLEGGKL